MTQKLVLGLMWFVVIFIVSYVGTGVILLFLILAPETNQTKYEAAQTFRNTYMIFFIIGSLILAILGTVTSILPGTKTKPQKKSSIKKKGHKKN
jgi:NADH:ubiquinone oxidoreductase subunit 6 (subunit J)